MPEVCSLPFPSAYWLQPSAETASGYTVELGSSVLPFLKRGRHQSPTSLEAYDGFSISAPILWKVGLFSDASQLTSSGSIEDSLTASASTTLLVDLDSQILCPHFSERDDLYDGAASEKIFYTVPATSLNYSTRYVVVVQNLLGKDQKLYPASALTAAYVDSYLFNRNQEGDERYARFIEPGGGAFAVLLAMGVDLTKIQLIW